MTRAGMEKIWNEPGVKCWGNVACWDDTGGAHPGCPLRPTCGAAAIAFRALIKKINKKWRKGA